MKTEIAYLIEQKHEHETCGIIPMWLCIGEKHLENDLNNEKLLNWTNNPNDEKLQKFKTYEDAFKYIEGTSLEQTCIVTEHLWDFNEKHLCEKCLTEMPEGEAMFKYHGYSFDCPETTESHIEKLIKLNDFETIEEYYQYMIDSYNNGQTEQCQKFYEQMIYNDKLMFLSYLIDRIFFDKKDFEFGTIIKKFLTFSL